MAATAAGSELVGGVLTAVGLGGPLGPMALIGTMAVATQTAHRDKGPFVADGGPELTLTNIAAATTIAVVGPGRFSLDRLLRVRPSKLLIALAAMAGVGTAAAVIQTQAVHRAEQEMTPVPAADMVQPEYVDVDLPVPPDRTDPPPPLLASDLLPLRERIRGQDGWGRSVSVAARDHPGSRDDPFPRLNARDDWAPPEDPDEFSDECRGGGVRSSRAVECARAVPSSPRKSRRCGPSKRRSRRRSGRRRRLHPAPGVPRSSSTLFRPRGLARIARASPMPQLSGWPGTPKWAGSAPPSRQRFQARPTEELAVGEVLRPVHEVEPGDLVVRPDPSIVG